MFDPSDTQRLMESSQLLLAYRNMEMEQYPLVFAAPLYKKLH